MSSSNYRVRVNADTCIGCGLCVKRCPMYALELEDAPEAKDRITVVVDEEKGEKELKNQKGKVSRVNPDQCIGCGVCVFICVFKCPSSKDARGKRGGRMAPDDCRRNGRLARTVGEI